MAFRITGGTLSGVGVDTSQVVVYLAGRGAVRTQVRWGGLVHAMDEMLTPYLDRVSKLGGIVRKDVYWPAAELEEQERWCGSVLRVKLYDGHV